VVSLYRDKQVIELAFSLGPNDYPIAEHLKVGLVHCDDSELDVEVIVQKQLKAVRVKNLEHLFPELLSLVVAQVHGGLNSRIL
jgi:hypothetical protein